MNDGNDYFYLKLLEQILQLQQPASSESGVATVGRYVFTAPQVLVPQQLSTVLYQPHLSALERSLFNGCSLPMVLQMIRQTGTACENDDMRNVPFRQPVLDPPPAHILFPRTELFGVLSELLRSPTSLSPSSTYPISMPHQDPQEQHALYYGHSQSVSFGAQTNFHVTETRKNPQHEGVASNFSDAIVSFLLAFYSQNLSENTPLHDSECTPALALRGNVSFALPSAETMGSDALGTLAQAEKTEAEIANNQAASPADSSSERVCGARLSAKNSASCSQRAKVKVTSSLEEQGASSRNRQYDATAKLSSVFSGSAVSLAYSPETRITVQAKERRAYHHESFPVKLHRLLREQAGKDDNIIFWLPDGSGFLIHKMKPFQKRILPLYFRHDKMASFRRQLNLYGFRRGMYQQNSGYYYAHELFHRDYPDRAELIKRLSELEVVVVPEAASAKQS